MTDVKSEPQEPSATPSTLERLIEFVESLRSKAEQSIKARREEAEIWRHGDEASHRDAHEMAERQSGRKIPYLNADKREEIAARADRIAAKYVEDVELFDGVLAALRPSEGPPSTRKPFSELRAEMSPESQARAAAQTEQILASRPSEGPRNPDDFCTCGHRRESHHVLGRCHGARCKCTGFVLADDTPQTAVPSEGPETGRPPVGLERLKSVAKGYLIDRPEGEDFGADLIRDLLAALPAGPETGDPQERDERNCEGCNQPFGDGVHITADDVELCEPCFKAISK